MSARPHPLSRAAGRPRSDAGLAAQALERLTPSERQAVLGEIADRLAERLRFDAATAIARGRMAEPEFRAWLRAAAILEIADGAPDAAAWPDAAALPLGPQ